jgi:hypothetical protein
MTLRAWIITMRGRVREALVPELQVLREGNRLLRAEVEKAEADAKEWQAIAYAPMKRASARSQEETMSESIKTRYTWLIEYATPSAAPAAHAHMQALGGEVVAVQFSDALGELSRAEAEVERLRADAERYRWLRDMDEDPVMSLAAQYTDCLGSAISISMRIDAAIDAALKEPK